MSRHIALFGGSFDPPHLGHQALVEAALAALGIDELWLLPVGIPVHKNLSGQATARQRKTWLEQMFAAEKKVKVVDWEINNPEPTPAIVSLRHFHAEFPQLTPTWLMGMDSFLDLPNWIEYPAHQQLCNLAVFHRKKYKKTTVTNTWQELSLKQWQVQRPLTAGHLVRLEVDLPDISASEIRQDTMAHKALLAQSTCNAILACYASPSAKT